VLAVSDGGALPGYLASLESHGRLVVGVPDAEARSVPDLPGAVVVPLNGCPSLGAAWEAILRAAPTDRCLLLREGEMLVAGNPATVAPFAAAVVVDVLDPLAPPDRLPDIRLVDRRRCRMTGALTPRLELDDPVPSGPAPAGSLVIVDTAVPLGPAYQAWLHRAGVAVAGTTDREEYLAIAEMLAGTGEYDAAVARLTDVLGAAHDLIDLRVARLLALVGLRRRRDLAAMAGVRRWAELTSAPGAAKAIEGLILIGGRRPYAAIELLEEALEAGLVDVDGYSVDRSWVEATYSRLLVDVPMERGNVTRRILASKATAAVDPTVIEAWNGCGLPYSEFITLFDGEARAAAVNRCLGADLTADPAATSALAEWFAEGGSWRHAVLALRPLAREGLLPLADAVAWSERRIARRAGETGPLETWAASGRAPLVGRVFAAAHLLGFDGGSTGRRLLGDLAPQVHPSILLPVALRLADEVPAAVGVFVEAASTTPQRRALLAPVADLLEEAA
jgi:hypothetical protein